MKIHIAAKQLRPAFFGYALTALALLVISMSSTQAAEKQQLFNGHDLSGWQGDQRVWSVRDGAIVGSSVDLKLAANTFLIWQGGEVADFRLTYKAKLEGDNNSGVQYRSRLLDPKTYRVVGYQADIHVKPEYTAMLFGEGTGRHIIAQRGTKATLETDTTKSSIDKKAFPTKPVDLSEWHEYTIVARGNHLVHQLDGVTTINITDNHAKKLDRGILALQVHAGPPMTVWFKEIELEVFDDSAAHPTSP